MATVREPTRAELARIEKHEAWLEYLAEIRKADPVRYDEVEPWAWARLLARLRVIDQKAKVAA